MVAAGGYRIGMIFPPVHGVAPESAPDPMSVAFAQARAAAARGEVPVGAVLLGPDGTIIARAGNRTEELRDPSAHAEMLVMRAATQARDGARLSDCTLYVTLEPCPMCAAAAVHFRVGRILFGAYDPKGGGVEHGPRLFARRDCLHRPETIGGLREREAAAMLRGFFRDRRDG
ncbi:tRNA-specific adenosine deaminase [Novacetimonas pomaceti]|uniref:tRNA-specific adenosine deaminase n=2 Tax=Novacetimonas pomaceti TaxID=2021998 RepID=A0A318QUC5_9PROT|nr:tRNA-specific adenosine deaminase [Novacetimonas pomaceti]PYD76323.1 tRNA-specific adenosine deaminase [Novacetimonas pomaceti]